MNDTFNIYNFEQPNYTSNHIEMNCPVIDQSSYTNALKGNALVLAQSLGFMAFIFMIPIAQNILKITKNISKRKDHKRMIVFSAGFISLGMYSIISLLFIGLEHNNYFVILPIVFITNYIIIYSTLVATRLFNKKA